MKVERSNQNNTIKKIRVGVLMGGKSTEREVSFNSGRTVCDHLDAARYDIIPIFQTHTGSLYLLPWHFLHRGKISDFAHRLATEAQALLWDDLKNIIDFMFITVHGQYAEDGTLQGFLELLKIPYLGSDVFSSALCMDKIAQKKILAAHGIAVAKSITVYPHEISHAKIQQMYNSLAALQLEPPYLIKPAREGSSLGISVVFKEEQLYNALHKAAYVASKPQPVLIEEKVCGMEFTCVTITDYHTNRLLPLVPTEIIPEKDTHFFCYEQKYMPGRAHKHTPARCSPEQMQRIQETCVRTMQALELTNMSRIDGFLTPEGTVIIVDPNSLSGMDPASFVFRAAAEHGMNHTQLINHLIETELHAYGMLDPLLQQETQRNSLMKHQKMRIAVLLGGSSNEREISLASGRNVIYKLSPHRYEPIALFMSSMNELYRIGPELLIRSTTKEIEELLHPKDTIKWAELPNLADFVFIALHGGMGENGCLQGTLEMLGLPYNGSSVLTSALCMDKFKACTYLRSCGFDVPRAELLHKEAFLSNREHLIADLCMRIGLPAIIKPHDDGCSVLVQRAEARDELSDALDHIFAAGKTYALVEECISGMELTVCCIGNKHAQALPPSQAIAANSILSIQEKFLPGAGENQTPAPLPDTTLQFVQRTIEKMYTALNCKGYCRIDCFYQDKTISPTGQERLVFIEANTLPGITPATCMFHQAAEIGMRPMEFIDKIITYGLEEHGHMTHVPDTAVNNTKQSYQPI